MAAEAMALIGLLFDIEGEIKDADLETRRRRRDTDTRVALVVIHEWMLRLIHGERPRSAICKAMQYTLNQWPALTLCADHPEIPIHNSTSELRLRQGVTGRKNYLFAGSEGGAASAERRWEEGMAEGGYMTRPKIHHLAEAGVPQATIMAAPAPTCEEVATNQLARTEDDHLSMRPAQVGGAEDCASRGEM